MGGRVRKAIRQAGTTQKDLARRLGEDTGTVSKWIAGKVLIPTFDLSRIAQAMGRDLTWFLPPDDGAPPGPPSPDDVLRDLPGLTARDREVLLALYRALVGQ